ncbi:MAG: BtpA/SgcQ family protein [Actinomycetota bacterium]
MIGPLIGMVHLEALPGAPGFAGDLDAVLAAAAADARALAEAGFDALIVENYGDAPFFADDVPKVTVAAMTRAVAEMRRVIDLPVGVNVLRNDALAGLAIAAATGAAFVRVNVLAGSMSTDQGVITGRAAEVTRLRSALGAPVLLLADVFVKHAVPPAGLTLEQAVADTWERAGADGLIVTGSGTRQPTPLDRVARVKAAAPGVPVYAGSGVTAATVAEVLRLADGVIVGTALKRDGATVSPVDPARARALVSAARG